VFNQKPEEEMAIGLSSFTPPADEDHDSSYHAIRTRLYQDENGTKSMDLDLINYNIGTAKGTRVAPNVTTQLRIDNQEGLTLTALQIEYITVPLLRYAMPSTSHIQGGGLVTIRGEPFVDTGPSQLLCRWRSDLTDSIYFSTEAYFVNSSAIVCRSPPLVTRERTRIDLSLTAGNVYTLNTVPFTFYETTGRVPFFGSSKGSTFVFVSTQPSSSPVPLVPVAIRDLTSRPPTHELRRFVGFCFRILQFRTLSTWTLSAGGRRSLQAWWSTLRASSGILPVMIRMPPWTLCINCSGLHQILRNFVQKHARRC